MGRSLFLLGRHKPAIVVFYEALRLGVDDWEVWHNKGMCNMFLKKYSEAIDCFKRSNRSVIACVNLYFSDVLFSVQYSAA